MSQSQTQDFIPCGQIISNKKLAEDLTVTCTEQSKDIRTKVKSDQVKYVINCKQVIATCNENLSQLHFLFKDEKKNKIYTKSKKKIIKCIRKMQACLRKLKGKKKKSTRHRHRRNARAAKAQQKHQHTTTDGHNHIMYDIFFKYIFNFLNSINNHVWYFFLIIFYFFILY
jgi:hypothetical protein